MWCKQLTSASWKGANELVVCLGRIPTLAHPTFSNARGKLTCEPLSNHKPSHQLLKAELPIIRRKRETVKRERRYPARGGERSEGFPGPALMGNAKPTRERPPPLEGNHLLADGTSWVPEPQWGHLFHLVGKWVPVVNILEKPPMCTLMEVTQYSLKTNK